MHEVARSKSEMLSFGFAGARDSAAASTQGAVVGSGVARPAFIPVLPVLVSGDPETLSNSCLCSVLDRETSGAAAAIVQGTSVIMPPPVCATEWFGELSSNGRALPSVIRANRWLMRAIDKLAASFPTQALGDALALEAAVQLHVVRPTTSKSADLVISGNACLPPYRGVALIQKYCVSGGDPRLTSDMCIDRSPKFETAGDAFMFDPCRVGLDWTPAHLKADADYGALLVAVVDLWPLTRPH